jgi:hypothetical protein
MPTTLSQRRVDFKLNIYRSDKLYRARGDRWAFLLLRYLDLHKCPYKSSECSFSLCWQRILDLKAYSRSAERVLLNISTQEHRQRARVLEAHAAREKETRRAFNRIFLSRVTDL